MSQNPDPDLLTFSMQVRIAGRRVLLRNALIGAAAGSILALVMSFSYISIIGLVERLVIGLVIGGVGALSALVGQIAARSEYAAHEHRQPFNWKFVIYSGLMMWWFTTIGLVFIEMTTQHGSAMTALFYTLIAVIVGAVVGVGLTIGASTAMRALRGGSSKQMLGEGGFDPLQHIESREHARR